MASTTYKHPGNVTAMYAAQEQFRDITKLVTKRHQFASIGNMVRNSGQLPQPLYPFWVIILSKSSLEKVGFVSL